MRYAEFLKKGDTIGFPAPSFGCSIDPYRTLFNNALKTFSEKCFTAKPGENAYKCDGIGISSLPENCAREFCEMWKDPSLRALISCGGGELMCEILPYIDWKGIKSSPAKIFQGYSDNTNLVYTLATICDTASIYGIGAADFGMEPWHDSIKDSFDLLCGEKLSFKSYERFERESLKSEENPLATLNDTEEHIHGAYIPASDRNTQAKLIFDAREQHEDVAFEGRLIGGCLDCLANLVGTKFDKTADFLEKYKDDGFVWFLESCDLNVYSIRRAMWQLENAGWFKYAKGFIFGRALNGEEMFGLNCFDAELETVKKLGVPAILDADIGHVKPMIPIICGSMGKVSLIGNKMTLEMYLR